MSVKVIEYGRRRRVRCSECGSMLEFDKNDMRYVQTGMNEGEKVIDCPVCGAQVEIRE